MLNTTICNFCVVQVNHRVVHVVHAPIISVSFTMTLLSWRTVEMTQYFYIFVSPGLCSLIKTAGIVCPQSFVVCDPFKCKKCKNISSQTELDSLHRNGP